MMITEFLFAQAENASAATQPKPGDGSHVTEQWVQDLVHGRHDFTPRGIYEQYHDDIAHFIKIVVLAAIVIALAYLLQKALKRITATATAHLTKLNPGLQKLILNVEGYLIVFVVCMILLDLFGINTASILAVLGTCGVAVALSLKDTLSNVAAGIVLLGMHPYEPGDYVSFDTVSGTINELGFFCTKLTTADGLEISVPNNTILGNPITNYSRTKARRMDITVGIAYGDDVDAAMQMLMEKIVAANPKILKSPEPKILVDELADSSVNLLIRVWAAPADYWDVFWDIKRTLKRTVEDNGFNFPFPQCDVHVFPAVPQQCAAQPESDPKA